VHANVPVKELGTWSVWLCCCLRDLTRDEEKPGNWVVLCTHVEKVKSFAPNVNHYVADVFVGPADRLPFDVEIKAGHAAVLHDNRDLSIACFSATVVLCSISRRSAASELDAIVNSLFLHSYGTQSDIQDMLLITRHFSILKVLHL
jgi:hypothetical protein